MAKKKTLPEKEKPSRRGPAPLPPDQKPLREYKNPRQPPREENVKPERPKPGRFHPGRGDLGGRG
jgi:hypothetical protein